MEGGYSGGLLSVLRGGVLSGFLADVDIRRPIDIIDGIVTVVLV